MLALLAAREEERAAADAAKDARIDALLVTVGELTAQVQALVLRLSKDSSTSSKPPSSDGPDRRPRGGSSRRASGRKPGKQPGDPGTALRLVDDPDERIAIPAPAACSCGTSLVEAPVTAVRRRQVHDLPPIPDPVVVEYAADVKCCPGCRANVTGDFPAGVNAPAQYGPEITTRVADVVVGHHVPVYRSTVLVMELLGMSVSSGFAASLRARAARLIREGGFPEAVKKLLAAAPVVHADETFARVDSKTAYVHVACTDHLTLLHTGNRSAEAIDAGGVLTELGAAQVLVRDGYAGYAHLTDVQHAWCGAHLLRDLRGIHEADPGGQLWAKAMADTLLEAHRIATAARAAGREALSESELRVIDRLYTGALARARTDNPAGEVSVLAGHARTLATRFAARREVILRFTTNLAVGFTNNIAERQIRPVKVQQRSSGGCWRTLQGLVDFAVVQSYLSTAAHWGITRFQALHRIFNGEGPWIPTTLTPPVAAA
ncbi:MAG: IS66 family transposase [Actinomycetales bacterium]|nr:IS66 family transposase [Actinomycetales bacterium]